MDIRIANEGSVFVFTICSEAGRAWVEENVYLESWQWLGNRSFAVDHRYADQLAAGMEEAGLNVT